MARQYDQFCALALALDRVAERWTPLILRDLAPGPKRFSDLLLSLRGIGTSMLTDRLRRLEDEGFVSKREVRPPTPATVYELTKAGRELFDALLPLIAWGTRYLVDVIPKPGDEIRPEWLLAAIASTFDPATAQGINDAYEFHVSDAIFSIVVEGGALRTHIGPAPVRPDLVVTTDWPTLYRVGFGRVALEDALSKRQLTFEGSRDALARCFQLFGPSRFVRRGASGAGHQPQSKVRAIGAERERRKK